ncbi:MAG: hypothetical protein FRX48_08707 [Lasallia pustulata]|uniref:DUF7924 domain-containing protein n=1 Tax=Lasallia pustulata TaxID=136370 RepID=A0A5M8PEX3_9LECA|nr:MAG: hypothetical protein FRX48_08707 [Lasallia pustulata]
MARSQASPDVKKGQQQAPVQKAQGKRLKVSRNNDLFARVHAYKRHSIFDRFCKQRGPTRFFSRLEMVLSKNESDRTNLTIRTLRSGRDLLKSSNEPRMRAVLLTAQEGRWLKEYFQQDIQLRKYLKQKSSFEEDKHEVWFKEQFEENRHEDWFKEEYGQIAIPSDQQPREAKSAKYRTVAYSNVLVMKTVPSDSLFSDDRFVRTCRKIQATYGATNLDHLNESVNKGWNSAITFYGPRLQPDYSVGFGRSAFTDKQLEELTPFVGEIADSCTSYFMGRWRMYFPFLTCEVKCGAVALDIADRQVSREYKNNVFVFV